MAEGFDPSRVHLLWAAQGEYSDRSEWPIALYENEELALADVLRGEALHRLLFGKAYLPWDGRKAKWETPEGKELKSIVGQECDDYDNLYLYCCAIEFRDASAIEARRAATGTGAVHESAVGDSRDAQPESQP